MSDTPKRLARPSAIHPSSLRTDDPKWLLEKIREWAAYREACREDIRAADLQLATLGSEIERRIRETGGGDA